MSIDRRQFLNLAGASALSGFGAVPATGAPSTVTAMRRDGAGRVLAPVLIDGKGPFLFLVDTAASRSALSARLASQVGLAPRPGAHATVNGVSGRTVVPLVHVASLETGELRLSRRELPVLSADALGECDGILGVDGLAGMTLDMDFARGRVSIERSRRRRALRGFRPVPAQSRFGGLLCVDATAGGLPVLAIIDSGAAHTFGNLELARMLRGRGPTPVGLAGLSLARPQLRYGDLHVFRAWDLERVPALLAGMDLLGSVRRLIIDYRRLELRVQP